MKYKIYCTVCDLYQLCLFLRIFYWSLELFRLWSSRYNWNIIESGVRHDQTKPTIDCAVYFVFHLIICLSLQVSVYCSKKDCCIGGRRNEHTPDTPRTLHCMLTFKHYLQYSLFPLSLSKIGLKRLEVKAIANNIVLYLFLESLLAKQI
jgi:hypothetical protein